MKTKRSGAGQAAAELAIILPLLLLILLGCLDVGRAFSVWLTLANGTREGARYACTLSTAGAEAIDGIVARTKDDIVAQGLPAEPLRIDVSLPPGMPAGAPVLVSASYSLPLTTLCLFGGRPLSIRASTQMAILPGGQP